MTDEEVVIAESGEELDGKAVAVEVMTDCVTKKEAWDRLPVKLTHLVENQQDELVSLLSAHKSVFRDTPGRTTLAMHDIDVGDSTPVKLGAYRLAPNKRRFLQSELNYMLTNDLIRRCQSEWSSPVTVVPKQGGSFRLCIDYRQVNSLTRTDSFPLPHVDDCIDQVGQAKFISKIDLMKGYWQVPLTPRAQDISCFVTSRGSFACRVMPFGLKNAPATFQRLMNDIIVDIPGCVVYIDDIIVFSPTWSEHLSQLDKLFTQLCKADLVVNLDKCEFVKHKVQYLGFVVGQGQVSPPTAKVDAIVHFPTPQRRKDVQRYLGMVGYYRRFINNFSEVTTPLTNLLCKGEQFVWSEACNEAFDMTKKVLSSYPVLRAPDCKVPFQLSVDASNNGAGAILLQEDSSGVAHPVCYFSRKFNPAQKNYSVVEKELLALIMSLQHFSVYVNPGNQNIVVYTDHHPLKFLNKFKFKNQRLTRWSLLLQEYNIEMRHIKGKYNVVANCLSRAV